MYSDRSGLFAQVVDLPRVVGGGSDDKGDYITYELQNANPLEPGTRMRIPVLIARDTGEMTAVLALQ